MAAQPIGAVSPPRSTVTIYTAEQYRAKQASDHPRWDQQQLDSAVRDWQKSSAKGRDAAEKAKAAVEAGPDRATQLRYARLNSPEGTAVRTTIRDTMMQLETARAATKAEKPGTQAYTKARAREQSLGAKLKAANERHRSIESGKVKVTGVAKPAAAPKAAKSVATSKVAKASEPRFGKPLNLAEHRLPGERGTLAQDQYNALLSGLTIRTDLAGHGGTYHYGTGTFKVTRAEGDHLTVMQSYRYGNRKAEVRTDTMPRQQLRDYLVKQANYYQPQEVNDLYPDRAPQSA
jgi:hypothetical protein